MFEWFKKKPVEAPVEAHRLGETQLGPPIFVQHEAGWQPISTANPKLHERVLLWWTTRGACSGYFDVDSDRNTSGWRGDQDLVIPRDQEKCTHWMPLPASPEVPRDYYFACDHSRPSTPTVAPAEPPPQENYMPIKAELLPCPFCGNPAVLTNVRESNHTFIVGCYNEMCVRPRTDGYNTKEDVIGLWNRRPDDLPTEDEVIKEFQRLNQPVAPAEPPQQETKPLRAPTTTEPHYFTPDPTKRFCTICGDNDLGSVWGIHRFQIQPGDPDFKPVAPAEPPPTPLGTGIADDWRSAWSGERNILIPK